MRGGDRRYNIAVSFLDAAQGGRQRIALGNERTLDVNIPAGIDNGQVIRLKGQGEPGIGAEPGDALIEVRVEDHEFFTRKGLDVHVELPVTLKEAVAGARIECPTIDGMVALKVPKHSNTGTQLRLRERGIAEPKSGRRGDQHVTLKVVLENAADPALERFVQGWTPKGDDIRRRFRL
jgi:DnaJ-class molecular chaperone